MKYLKLKPNTALLVTDPLNRKYFSGVDIDEGYLVFTAGSAAYFTDARYFGGTAEGIKKAGAAPKLFNGLSDIGDYLTANGVKTLLVDYDNTTLTEYEGYKQLGVKIKDGSALVKGARVVKSAEEVACIRKGCEITHKAFYESFAFIKEGITELELKQLLENKFVELGGEGASFETIVAFGANSAVPHHKSDGTKLIKNTPVLIDMGAKYKGYASDFTRTVFFGKPNERFKKAYAAVLYASDVAEESVRSGMTGKEADSFARNALASAGYKDNFTHSLGHGVGLEIHESPRLSIKSSDVLSEGMVFTIEPGVYFDGEFGIRTEDTCVMRNGRAERLYIDSKALITL